MDMYIEFSLPKGSPGRAGSAAAYVNRQITNALHQWSDKYNIPYNSKIHKFTKRVTFDSDEHYTLFSITWNVKKDNFLDRWRIVSDLNNKI